MMKVMLADDEPIMRKALQTLPDWAALECEIVYTASNGKEVLENLEKQKPDILVTDIKMPGADGIEISKYIWENKIPVKVIILTAYADFSYAQSAVRYNVVDYVTKTGVMDGLEAAVKKCKGQLEEERKTGKTESESLAAENFLRAVFDGSLYEEEEIGQGYTLYVPETAGYRVLLFCFRFIGENEKKQWIYGKVDDFIQEVFPKRIIKSLFMKRDMLCVLLRDKRNSEKDLASRCRKISEMAENFLNIEICMGISNYSEGAGALHSSYRQAENIIRMYFLDGRDKVNFYNDKITEKEKKLPETDSRIEDICREIQRGDSQLAANRFKDLLEIQRKMECSADDIKNAGMAIQARCRKILENADDTAIYGEEHSGGLAGNIYNCLYSDEYEEIMLELIKNTVRATGAAYCRKDNMIAECQSYIAQHYAEPITVAEIAGHLGTSISYLSRIFKEATGNTVIATINSMKLEKAKEYLEKSDLKIYEIADALGFENVTYFSHFFKKQTGVSPKEWHGCMEDKAK